MFHKVCLFLLLAAFPAVGSTQTLEARKDLFGYEFLLDRHPVPIREVVTAVAAVPEAAELAVRARSQKRGANILAGIGGAFIGWELGKILKREPMNGTVTGIGVGFVVLAIPVQVSGNRKAIRAIDLYNASVSPREARLRMSVTENGGGLVVTF